MSVAEEKQITDRQLEIIQAAGKILTRSGVSGLTIKNLAKEMQFSEPALYRHFSSREEIILGLLTYLSENISDKLELSIADSDKPTDKIKALFRNQMHFFANNPHFVAAVFSDGLMEESERINEAISKLMGKKTTLLTPILKSGQGSGEFTTAIPTEELLHVVMGSFRLLMFKWRLAHFEFDLVFEGEKLLQSILTLIKSKAL